MSHFTYIPNYRWVCHRCNATNQAERSNCFSCDFPAIASTLEVESACRSNGQEVLSVNFDLLLLKRLYNWLIVRAWPVWGVIFIGLVHYFLWLHYSIEAHRLLLNKSISSATQIVGGVFVLLSIDSNLHVFNKRRIIESIQAWIREVPVVSRSIFLSGSCCASSSMSGAASLTTSHRPNTLDERVAEIERQIGEIRSELARNFQAITSRIETVKDELSKSIFANQQALDNLSSRVETVTVGNFKQQAFGVALVIYGAITSVFA